MPLSTVAPHEVEPYHHRIVCGAYRCLDLAVDSWAKCDMLTHAAFARLDRPFQDGKRSRISLKAEDFLAIKKAVLCAIGFPQMVQHL